ncbi:MAG: RNA-binding S4 domain-containing protein [Peptoniphilaceae bacterium]
MEKDYIKLDNFLKINDLVQSSGEAKMIILDGYVKVNGEEELRRGRKLYKGDIVTFDGEEYTVGE